MPIRLLPIARPCRESFAAMAGDEQTRFCETCGKHVYDLSSRTEEEARALLREKRGARTCVRFAKDANGNVLFRAAALAAAVSMTACSSATAEPAKTVEVDHDMGDAVPDSLDVCPAQPSADDDGCPQPDAGDPGPTRR